jgi:hypothetical protein
MSVHVVFASSSFEILEYTIKQRTLQPPCFLFPLETQWNLYGSKKKKLSCVGKSVFGKKNRLLKHENGLPGP